MALGGRPPKGEQWLTGLQPLDELTRSSLACWRWRTVAHIPPELPESFIPVTYPSMLKFAQVLVQCYANRIRLPTGPYGRSAGGCRVTTAAASLNAYHANPPTTVADRSTQLALQCPTLSGSVPIPFSRLGRCILQRNTGVSMGFLSYDFGSTSCGRSVSQSLLHSEPSILIYIRILRRLHLNCGNVRHSYLTVPNPNSSPSEPPRCFRMAIGQNRHG